MSSFLFPISYAFLTFPIAAALFTIPFLVVQYRRHGYVNKVRALVLYLFLLYLMNAVFLIVLPLPDSRHNPPPPEGSLQLIPFHFLADIMSSTSVDPGQLSTYWRFLYEWDFQQAALNVVLTVPFGLILRYYFRTRWGWCMLLSFLLSLFFEITQLTGIYGFYDHPYRVFDVDDLITNTFGGIVGFLLAHWLSRHLPKTENLDQNVDVASKRVSYTRRGVAFLFDLLMTLAAFMVLLWLGFPGPAAFLVSTGIYFMLLPWLTKGKTLGKWLVRIHLEGHCGRLTFVSLFIRYGLLYGMLAGINLLFLREFNELGKAFKILCAFGVVIVDLAFISHLLQHLIVRDSVLFYERISRTAHKVTWHSNRKKQNPPPSSAKRRNKPFKRSAVSRRS